MQKAGEGAECRQERIELDEALSAELLRRKTAVVAAGEGAAKERVRKAKAGRLEMAQHHAEKGLSTN